MDFGSFMLSEEIDFYSETTLVSSEEFEGLILLHPAYLHSSSIKHLPSNLHQHILFGY
jgi:hypothetical protein